MGLFGPSKKEVWSQLCEEINGDLVDGGFWKGSRVEAHHSNWTIYLDTYTVSTGKSSTTYTRMRAPFVNREGLQFKIYRQNVFSELGKAFGMQDIEVGYEPFDQNYVIKGNNEDSIRRLFASGQVRELIEKQPQVRMEIKKSEGLFGPTFAEDEGELYFLAYGVIKDIELLKGLFELFSEVLETLSLIGSATDAAPTVEL